MTPARNPFEAPTRQQLREVDRRMAEVLPCQAHDMDPPDAEDVSRARAQAILRASWRAELLRGGLIR